MYGGRALTALRYNLGRMAGLVAPLCGLVLLEPAIAAALFPTAATALRGAEFLLLLLLTLLSWCVLSWTAARLALFSRKERVRTQPSLMRAALSCTLVFLFMRLLPTNAFRPLLLFAAGIALHFLAQPERDARPSLAEVLDSRHQRHFAR